MNHQEYSELKARIEKGSIPQEFPAELRRFYKPDRTGKYRLDPWNNYTLGTY
jgi:hypothetical protein